MTAPATLAIDIGGTKILAALVQGANILRHVRIDTPAEIDPARWMADLARETRDWRFGAVGIAATGLVQRGRWRALNRRTLDIPEDFPLEEVAARSFGRPVHAANDAQAAAWGEYRFGAGAGGDMVFVTVSTGIGGGVVLGGRLLPGIAGSFGQWRSETLSAPPAENRIAGRFIAEAATAHAEGLDAKAVFAAAADGLPWARAIVAEAAERLAVLASNVELAFATGRIVIGGSIGLAPGFRAAVESHLDQLQPHLRPTLVTAALGGNAGLIGIADLAGSTIVNSNKRGISS